MFNLDLERAEGPEIKLPTSTGSQKKTKEFQKTSTSASLTTLKSLTVWITTNCGKFLKGWEYQVTLFASLDTCTQVKKHHFEWDMEQRIGSKLEKEYVKAVYYHLAYLTYIQSTSCEMLGWMKHKLESRLLGVGRLLGEVLTTSDMQMIPP